MQIAPTLVVLAAGMGSRYGGLKQLDPMGPNGETVLDYSVYDAVRAGFEQVVFVIRRDIEDPFRNAIGSRYSDSVQIRYAFQDLEDLPDGFELPAERIKPWGTGHALRAARQFIKGPFAVINADDFYGADAFQVLCSHLTVGSLDSRMLMVGYPLENTLSPHGSVNRGLCQQKNGTLLGVREIVDIKREDDGSITGTEADGESTQIEESALVSMNFWGFSEKIFPLLKEEFIEFLSKEGNELKSEFYIPAFVDRLINSGKGTCSLLSTTSNWFGVTYPEDKAHVQGELKSLVEDGEYPSPLKL